MSELPAGWVATSLFEVAEPRRERVRPQLNLDEPFIGLEHVEAHTTRVLGSLRGGDVRSSASLFQEGDVLYGRLRPYLNKVAKPEFGGLASAEFIVFPDQPHLRSGFLKLRLSARDFVSFASHLNAGDRPRVDFDQIGAFPISLPPPAEQMRIAAKVEELLSDLDAGIGALERARANLNRYRAAVLKAAIEGRLTEKWRAAHPDVEPADKLLERILAERRKRWEEAQLAKYAEKGQPPPKGWKERYAEPLGTDAASLRELPKGWRWVSLDQMIVSGPQNGLYLPRDRYGDGIPILRIDDYQNFSSRSAQEMQKVRASVAEISTYALQKRDLIVNRVNSLSHLGKCLVISEEHLPAVFESNMMRATLSDYVEPDYVATWLRTTEGKAGLLRNAKWAVNQASINQQDVCRIPVPLPPLAEQRHIVVAVHAQLDAVERAEVTADAQGARAARLRQSILKFAFEGKLVPQDPNDEPARELLERIRKEREGALSKLKSGGKAPHKREKRPD